MARLATYKEVGGLDGRFFAHMEEIDLCWRLRCRGYEVRSVASSVVYHVGGATLNAGHPRKTFLNFRNNLLMLYKNLPAEELASVMRMRCLLDYVAMLKFLLTFDFANAKAVIRARKEFKRVKKDYLPQREENLRLMTTPHPEGRSRICLLWNYYAKGKKKFSDLHP
jgi:GT2 family glycosyltransferase